MILIDAEEMEKNGWAAQRIVQVDPHTMEWQRKKPTDFPAIDAVPVKHGEWLPYEFCTDGTWDKCSVCGVAHRTRSKYTGYIDGKEYTIQDRMNYCPNCGAKMDGERKDDE